MFASGGETRSDFVAIDLSSTPNHLYASDTGNSRVLGWRDATAFKNGAPADLVIGQPDFSSYWADNGGIGANSLNSPTGVAVDSHGNLYVGDSGNFRVLEYTNPFTACAGQFPVRGRPGGCGVRAMRQFHPAAVLRLHGEPGLSGEHLGGTAIRHPLWPFRWTPRTIYGSRTAATAGFWNSFAPFR